MPKELLRERAKGREVSKTLYVHQALFDRKEVVEIELALKVAYIFGEELDYQN